MTEYHKINAPFNRDGHGVLLYDEWCLPEFEYLALNDWRFTEKVDGTNIRLYFERFEDYVRYEIAGRTDNAQFPAFLFTMLDELCKSIQNAVGSIMVEREIDELVIYGEGYGPKIQHGGKYRDAPGFVVFDVKVGEWWLRREDVETFCKDVGLDIVPVLGYGSLYDAINLVRHGAVYNKNGVLIDRAITLDQGNRLKSEWGNFEAEGIVAVPIVPLFDRAGRRIITKIKGRDFRDDYLLHERHTLPA